MPTLSLSDAAQRLALDGYRVLPLTSGGKVPTLTDWPSLATTSAETIAGWWTAHPTANIGVATGAGLLVIDIDDGGEETIRALEAELGGLPATRTVRTGNGGQHLYFTLPAGLIVANSVRRVLGHGLDIRAEGGQVVAPPSRLSSGGVYTYIDDGPVAPLPYAWVARIQDGAPRRAAVSLDSVGTIPDGARDDTLFRIASSWRARGMSENEILAALTAANQDRCSPPLPQKDVERIARSVGKYPQGEAPAIVVRRASVQTPPVVDGAVPAVGTLLSDVVTETISWLWLGRIPLGKLTIIDGDPGLSKSTLTLDLGARVSRGDDMPDHSPGIPAAGVVLVTGEDGLADTVKPRLEAAGADCSRVVSLTTVPTPEGDRMLTLPDDIATIEAAIDRVSARLVVIDPLMAYLGDKTNSFRDQDVRRALTPLALMAEARDVAVVVVRHLNKGAGGSSAVYRGGGSIGIIGIARSGLLVAKDPDDESFRVLASVKSNLGKPPASLRYRVLDDNGRPRIEWHGDSSHGADALVAEAKPSEDPSQRDAAVEFLRELLMDGPVAVREIQDGARDCGIGWRTIERAKSTLKIRASKVKGLAGLGWRWELPLAAPA